MRILLLVLSPFALLGCESAGLTVHFVLPTDFRGAIAVCEDPNGVDWPAPRNNSYQLQVPPSGELRFKTIAPLRNWHGESAAFQGGAAIEKEFVDEGINGVRDDVIRFYSCWGSGDCVWYVAGTREDITNAFSHHQLSPGRQP